MRKFLLFIVILFSGCAILFSCNYNKASDKSAASTIDTVAIRKAVDSVNNVFMQSIAKGDAAGAVNCYTTDIKFMAPNAPALSDKKSIQTLFEGMIKGGVAKLEVKTTNLWITANLLAEDGTYVLSAKDGKQIDKGKYITLWRKDNGQWKMFRDGSSSDLPLPAGK